MFVNSEMIFLRKVLKKKHLDTKVIAQYIQNKQALLNYYGDPASPTSTKEIGVSGPIAHYELLRSDMDASLIADVVSMCTLEHDVVPINEFNRAPPWLKPYWLKHLVD